MPAIKQYLDLDGLSLYDGAIKTWSNSANQAAYKTILKSADGNYLLLYKKTGAALPADAETYDARVELGGGTASTKLDALASIVGATWDSENEEYDIILDDSFPGTVETVVDAINALQGELLALDATVVMATENAGVVTFKTGIKQEDGLIAGMPSAKSEIIEGYLYEGKFYEESTHETEITLATAKSYQDLSTNGKLYNYDGTSLIEAAKDIVFAKVATTGAAEDVSTAAITDGAAEPATLYPASTTQAVLQGIARDLNSLESDSVVTVYSPTSSEYAAVYEFYQGDDGSHAAAKKIGTINIPKDMVVSAGSVVDIVFVEGTGGDPDTLHEGSASGPDVTEAIKGAGVTPTAADAGKYIKLTIANAELSTLYIPASSLVDVYTGGITTEITVAIDQSTNVITATINDIAGTKITYVAAQAAVYDAVEAGATFDADTTYYTRSAEEPYTYTVDSTVDAENFDTKIAAGLYTLTSAAVSRESVTAALTRLDGSNTTPGSVAKKVKDAIDALDTSSDVGIASYNSTTTAITFTGSISETDGIVGAGSAESIVISPIASADISNLFSSSSSSSEEPGTGEG